MPSRVVPLSARPPLTMPRLFSEPASPIFMKTVLRFELDPPTVTQLFEAAEVLPITVPLEGQTVPPRSTIKPFPVSPGFPHSARGGLTRMS